MRSTSSSRPSEETMRTYGRTVVKQSSRIVEEKQVEAIGSSLVACYFGAK